LEAQGFQLSGHLFAVIEGDTVPMRNHWVTLHEVTSAGGRVVDSVRTDALGVYFLRSPARDTTAMYLSSVSFRDIAYFSDPVRSAAFTSDTASTLFVYDTSSVGPPIRVVERHVVVRAPEVDGSRSALEVLVLENLGSRTRVTSDTANPVWQGAIPDGALGFEVGPSDISAAALYRRGDVVALAAAMPPGPANQRRVVFGYILPRGMRDLVIPVDQDVGRLQVLVEDPAVEMLGGPLRPQGAEFMEDVQFMRFDGTDLIAGADPSFRLSGGSRSLPVLLWLILAMSAVAMAVVFTVWLRRPRIATVLGGDLDVLAAQVAALDERFAAKGANPSEAEREAYRAERDALKAKLSEALAQRDSAG
jgi:hypothetical protein